MTLPSLNDFNGWADYWRNEVGVNVIPADSRYKRPLVTWSEWQHNPIPEELHKQWKSENIFSKGLAIVLGKVWHRPDKLGYYFSCVDTDNEIATKEVSISGNRTIVEQHTDRPDKTHSYLYSQRPIKKKGCDVSPINPDLASKLSNNEIPSVEVKCEGSIMYCTPGFHKSGYRYEFVGLDEPVTLTLGQADEFEKHIDDICRKYGLTYLGDGNGNISRNMPIEELFKPEARILEGHNRHEALLRVMESLIARNASILYLEQIRNLAREWNEQHCLPPLDNRGFERQWKDAARFVASKDDGIKKKDGGSIGSSSSKKVKLVEEASEQLMNEYKFVTIEETKEILYCCDGRYFQVAR
jgi:Bifunctional DNA primase/polymerase, N-terminal